MVEANQAAQKLQVYYIIHERDVPENVMTFGIEPMGLNALKERWLRDKFDVMRVFWYDPLRAAVVRQIVEMGSTPYLGVEKQRIVPNVHEVIWHLSMQLDVVNKA